MLLKLYRTFSLLLLPALTLISLSATAQDDYSALITKYKGEPAIVTNNSEHLVISYEGGKLAANSHVEQERLLLNDLAPGIYNSVYIYHSYFDQLGDYDAMALVPNNGGYKKIKEYITKTNSSQSQSIFYDDSKLTELTFTGLAVNSVIKANYTLSYTDIHMLPDFYFKEHLPVAKAEFKVTAPKYVQLNFVIRGEHKEMIKETREENRNTVTYTFTATDVPALKTYEDVPSLSYYMPMVIPYIVSYQLPHDDQPTTFLKDTTALYKYLYAYIKNVNTKQDEKLAATVKEIIANDNSPAEKAKHIYQWVQKNIHYIAFEDSLGGFVPRQAADICQRKFGDCKDMASILTAMCTLAEIEAHYTWIGTRHLPYVYKETPLPLVSNHMICTIKLGGEWIFLDGTDPVIPFGANPAGIQGKEALMSIDENNFKILRVPETPAANNELIDTTYLKIDKQGVAGNVVLNYKGYGAWDLGYLMVYYKNDQREDYIKGLTTRGSNKYIQKSYKFEQSPDATKSARVFSDFTIDNYVQNAGKEQFINLNLKNNSDYQPIDVKDRTTPYYTNYKTHTKEVVVLEIPSGYTVTNVPPDAHESLGDIWNYSIAYKINPDNVTLVKEYTMNSLTIPADQFAENNKLVEHLKKQFKESIPLTAK